jgi:NAD(P)-dependent dehydrogenase (short-subunit alcohol dehydrogenase family)
VRLARAASLPTTFSQDRSTPTLIPPTTSGPSQLAATALKLYGNVEDIAPLVAFVAGPAAGYIAGASLTVDGGTNA